MDPAKRSYEWIDELVALDDYEARCRKLNEILTTLVDEDDNEVASRTLRTIVMSESIDLSTLLKDTDSFKFYKRYARYIIETVESNKSDDSNAIHIYPPENSA